ncbi:sulfotransferase [Paracoccus laeviglucosivorans]|uniref:LPS sulfotransferase NodH n=1 Tax=Paracoccus laeviglucosivorans TaxID=1197861 RepID=A0A521FNX1_9RHOB|nr:sulfotransferase [Paracoccus laeviglucosivorans]SMO97862.1 LPS sulfotransferase NodH [Paracoccus laeviglucosivorans]
MTQPFQRFVVFAEMRTGSNLLEATLNSVKRVTCFGEAFNPYMMGWPDKDELKGITRAEREEDPHRLLRAIWDKPNHLAGFRYFHDHDPRVFDAIMDDRACAKIILTRNPVDSFVSTALARQTNQWKLNATETPIPAAAHFDAAEFRQVTARIEEFQLRVQHRLQATGQSAFWLGYEDLRDADVMTGLLHWLGRRDIDRVLPASDQVPQNPRELSEKVTNFAEMEAELAQLDPFMLRRIPNFEPRKGPAVPSYMASEAGKGLIFMPIKGGPTDTVAEWLRAMGPVLEDLNQNGLRQWKRDHAGHRSFTVLRHPLLRAWAAFDGLVTGNNAELRRTMRDIHRVALPRDEELGQMTEAQQVELFAAFLDFLRRNLNDQTTLPTYPHWASQSEIIAGFSRMGSPDMVLREADLALELGWLVQGAGVKSPAALPEIRRFPEFLSEQSLRGAAKKAYLRDYVAFGFGGQP